MTDKELAATIAKDIVVALISTNNSGIDYSAVRTEKSAIPKNIEKTSEIFSGIYDNVLEKLKSTKE